MRPSFSRSIWLCIAVHAGRADDDKALADHGFQLRDQLRDSLGRIDDLDHDGNVEGRILTGDIVELPVRTVAELDGEHGSAGQVPAACRLDNRAIERHSMPLLDGLAVDAEKTRFGTGSSLAPLVRTADGRQHRRLRQLSRRSIDRLVPERDASARWPSPRSTPRAVAQLARSRARPAREPAPSPAERPRSRRHAPDQVSRHQSTLLRVPRRVSASFSNVEKVV